MVVGRVQEKKERMRNISGSAVTAINGSASVGWGVPLAIRHARRSRYINQQKDTTTTFLLFLNLVLVYFHHPTTASSTTTFDL